MGPAVKNKLIYFMGLKGGVGCSILSSLLARIASKKGLKIGLADSTPSPYSLVPSYLSLPPAQHHLLQLQPYRDRLTPKVVESFFALSPDGVAHIPIKPDDETPAPFHQVFPLLESLSQCFDFLWLDLSSFPHDQYLSFWERNPRAVFISSLDPSSLTAAQQWQKRLLSRHFQLQQFGLVLNHQSASPTAPKDVASWMRHFTYLGAVPFLGEDLSIQAFEGRALPAPAEKCLSQLCEKILALAAEPSVGSPGPSNPAPSHRKAPPPDEGPRSSGTLSLEQIHSLHQKLLEHLRRSGDLKDPKNNEWSQRQSLEPHAREILDQLIQDEGIPDRETRQKLATETLNLAFGLGPLEPLLQNEEITEIMVNGPHRVYVEKKGCLN